MEPTIDQVLAELKRTLDLHATACGARCIDSSEDGTCDQCGVSMDECPTCEGVGYHHDNCGEMEAAS